MHFIYPIGLIALAGLLIPLIIHLWKLKKGQTLRIGSIALLGAGSPFTSRSYQITDWLLLFLRMLLIALLAFFLAEPYWLKKENGTGGQKGWVLLEQDNLPFLYQSQKKSIDSLMLAGYELHDFGLGFQKISLKDTANVLSDKASVLSDTVNLSSGLVNRSDLANRLDKSTKLSYYALLRELNGRIEPKFPVYLYTDHRLSNLGGDLPLINFHLIWKEIKGADTLSTWSTSFAHKTFEAKSSPALTSFKRLDEAQDNAAIKVLIYAADHPEDVNYLNAAIAAIAQETKRKIEVEVFNNKNYSALSFDVGFWISAKPVDSGFSGSIRKGGRLFNYAGEKVSLLNSWLELEPAGKGNIGASVVRKRTASTADPGRKIWTDGFGIPLLTLSKEKNFDHYRFYSRINPNWTDLVWNEKFVEAMMPIVLGNDGTETGFGFEMSPDDQRSTAVSLMAGAPAQLSGDQLSGAKSTIEKTSNDENIASLNSGTIRSEREQPLQKALWLTAILVLTLERFLSFRHKNKLNHG